ASITPAFTSSWLYFVMSASSCSEGRTPASVSAVALTITMNRISVSSRRRFARVSPSTSNETARNRQSDSRILEEPGEQPRADRHGVEEDVLVLRVRAAALGAEPVEDGHAEGSFEVAVGASARGAFGQLESELAAVPARRGEERAGRVR